MTARLHALVIRTPDPARLSAFWDGLLADPDGNEFCVIEAGNNWLAGAGFFGELAADGIREVGVFWAAALDWPLVWDEDGETAISPPEGGFKIAWGGEPLNEYAGRHRLVLELVADDLVRCGPVLLHRPIPCHAGSRSAWVVRPPRR